jgi:hypothetical protein
VKVLNRDFKLAGKKRLLDLSSLDEWRNEAYENARLFKEKVKLVGKLLSKWEGPYVIEEVYHSGAIKIASLKDDTTQVVNGQRLKHYIAGDSYNEDVDVIQTVSLKEFIQDNMQNLQSSFSNR